MNQFFGKSPLVGFNTKKNLASLHVPAERCEPRITLCPPWAMAYMNSFSIKFGNGTASCLWTLGSYLAFCSANQGRNPRG